MYCRGLLLYEGHIVKIHNTLAQCSPNFFSLRPLFASKNNHGSSQPCSCKCSVYSPQRNVWCLLLQQRQGQSATKCLVLAVTATLGTVHNEMSDVGCYSNARDSPQRNIWCWLLKQRQGQSATKCLVLAVTATPGTVTKCLVLAVTATPGTVRNEMSGVGCYSNARDSPQRNVWCWLLQQRQGQSATKCLVLAVTATLGTVRNEMSGVGCYSNARDSPQRNV